MKGRDIMLSKEAKQILNYLKPLFLAGEDTIDSSSVIKATGLPEIEVKRYSRPVSVFSKP